MSLIYSYLCWLMQVCSFPHLYVIFPICVALGLLSLCHWCTLCGTWQHRIAHHGGWARRANPETKPATASWSDLNMNRHYFEISVEPKLGTETSKYSAWQFWTTACQHLLAALDAIQCWNCLRPVKRSRVTWYSIAAPSSHLLYFFLVV